MPGTIVGEGDLTVKKDENYKEENKWKNDADTFDRGRQRTEIKRWSEGLNRHSREWVGNGQSEEVLELETEYQEITWHANITK